MGCKASIVKKIFGDQIFWEKRKKESPLSDDETQLKMNLNDKRMMNNEAMKKASPFFIFPTTFFLEIVSL